MKKRICLALGALVIAMSIFSPMLVLAEPEGENPGGSTEPPVVEPTEPVTPTTPDTKPEKPNNNSSNQNNSSGSSNEVFGSVPNAEPNIFKRWPFVIWHFHYERGLLALENGVFEKKCSKAGANNTKTIKGKYNQSLMIREKS